MNFQKGISRFTKVVFGLAMAVACATANALTVSKNSGPTTPDGSQFPASYGDPSRQAGYNAAQTDKHFRETLTLACGPGQTVSAAKLTVTVRKLSQGSSRGDNDSISFWHNGTPHFNAYLWKNTDVPGTTNTQAFDLGSLPTSVYSGKPLNLGAGLNKLTPLVNNPQNKFSFFVQDDTSVQAAQLDYTCAGRVVADATAAGPGVPMTLPHVGSASSATATATATATPSYGFTQSATSNPSCGPWQVCFDVNVADMKGQPGVATATLTLNVMQNGAVVKTLTGPVLNADGKYCFTINPSDINLALGGFDYVASGAFVVNGVAGLSTVTQSIGQQSVGVAAGTNNDIVTCTQPQGGTASTCCPPLSGGANMQNMFTQTAHPAGQGYTMVGNTSGAQYATLATGYNAYLGYLKFVCPNVVALKVTWSIHNASAIGGPLSPVYPAANGYAYSTFTGSGTPPMVQGSPALSSYIAMPGQAYGIHAHTVGIDAQGREVKCGFDAATCDLGDRFTFQWSVGNRVAGGAQAPLNVGN